MKKKFEWTMYRLSFFVIIKKGVGLGGIQSLVRED